MARLEDYLKAAITGGMSGLQTGQASGNALRNAIMTKQVEASLQPKEWKPTTMQEALNFENAKAGIVKPQEVITNKKNLLQIQDLKQKQEDIKNQKEFASQNILDTANDTLNTIKEVKNGINYFGAVGAIPTLNPWDFNRIKWEKYTDKLLSQKVVDLITTMKSASKTGATGFGQLSDKEGQILREASTALNKRMSPKDASEILDTMESKLKKVVGNVGNVNENGIKQIGDIPSGYERRRYKDGTIKDVKIGS